MNEQRGRREFEGEGDREIEEYDSRVSIWTGRRDVKRSKPEQQEAFAERGQPIAVADITDDMIELTPAGMEHARQEGGHDSVDQAVAFGSPKVRAQETVLLRMAGNTIEITGKESMAGLEEKVAAAGGIKKGSKARKVGTEPRLDFLFSNTAYEEKVNAAYDEGRLLEYLVAQSDTDAELLGEKESFTYRRAAAKLSELYLKYLDIAPRWEALVKAKPDRYSKTLQRFLGSHNGVVESFLARAIEETKGRAERDRFVQAVGRGGFDFSEGFTIDILTHGAGHPPTMHIRYAKQADKRGVAFAFDEEINKETLDSIVSGTKRLHAVQDVIAS